MVHSDVAKDVLHNIILLYVKLHSFFFCKGHWKHKMKLKELKSKTLQNDIGRASKEIVTKTGIFKLNRHVILAIYLWHKKHAFYVFFIAVAFAAMLFYINVNQIWILQSNNWSKVRYHNIDMSKLNIYVDLLQFVTKTMYTGYFIVG